MVPSLRSLAAKTKGEMEAAEDEITADICS